MTIPIYDIATMPAIIYPIANDHEETEIYLGNRAVTGYVTADITLKARNDAHIALLYDFWLTDCNYGLEPFLVPLPLFGRPTNEELPSLLVRFKGKMSVSKDNSLWSSSLQLDIIGTIDYIIDDEDNFVVADTGEYTVTNNGDYVPTGNIINSYREVFYGTNS